MLERDVLSDLNTTVTSRSTPTYTPDAKTQFAMEPATSTKDKNSSSESAISVPCSSEAPAVPPAKRRSSQATAVKNPNVQPKAKNSRKLYKKGDMTTAMSLGSNDYDMSGGVDRVTKLLSPASHLDRSKTPTAASQTSAASFASKTSISKLAPASDDTVAFTSIKTGSPAVMRSRETASFITPPRTVTDEAPAVESTTATAADTEFSVSVADIARRFEVVQSAPDPGSAAVNIEAHPAETVAMITDSHDEVPQKHQNREGSVGPEAPMVPSTMTTTFDKNLSHFRKLPQPPTSRVEALPPEATSGGATKIQSSQDPTNSINGKTGPFSGSMMSRPAEQTLSRNQKGATFGTSASGTFGQSRQRDLPSTATRGNSTSTLSTTSSAVRAVSSAAAKRLERQRRIEAITTQNKLRQEQLELEIKRKEQERLARVKVERERKAQEEKEKKERNASRQLEAEQRRKQEAEARAKKEAEREQKKKAGARSAENVKLIPGHTSGSGVQLCASLQSKKPQSTIGMDQHLLPANTSVAQGSLQLTESTVLSQTSDVYENYDISGLESDVSTDDEDEPRKAVPKWAQGASLRSALYNQFGAENDISLGVFDRVPTPNLKEIFPNKKKHASFRPRTSSAMWEPSPDRTSIRKL